MIVVDFIDMDRPHNREKVTRAFNDHLRRDRSKAAVTRISELGLIEMTRKRTRESLLHSLTEPCSSCEGKGYTKSRSTVAYELLREIRRQGGLIESDTILIEAHPDVAQVLATTDRGFLEDLEKRFQKRLVVKARGSFHMEDFEIRSPGEKAIEKSEMAGGRDKERDEPKRRRRRKRALGSPADVEALLAEEERAALSPELLAEADAEASAQAAAESEALAAQAEHLGNGATPANGEREGQAPEGQQDVRAEVIGGALPAGEPATPTPTPTDAAAGDHDRDRDQ
jgi:hypothetical protein